MDVACPVEAARRSNGIESPLDEFDGMHAQWTISVVAVQQDVRGYPRGAGSGTNATIT
jgi:hypothetical protein